MENNLTGTIKLQLNKLQDVEIVDYKGEKCVCVPVAKNGIFLSEKGGIYLDFFMGAMKEEMWGYTHSIKRKLTAAEYKAIPKNERSTMPACGYFQPYTPKYNNSNNNGGGNNNGGEYQSYGGTYRPAPKNDPNDISDMPF